MEQRRSRHLEPFSQAKSMTYPQIPRSSQRRNFAQACLAIFAASQILAQQAPSPDAATLAKYVRNHNGVLDADELSAMQADQAKSAQAASSSTTTSTEVGDTVQLSPFEVVSDT